MNSQVLRLCYLADPTSTHTVKWVSFFLRQPGFEVHLMGWSRPSHPGLAGVHFHYLPEELTPPFVAPVRTALWRAHLWPIAQYQQFRLLLEQIKPDIFDILMLNAPDFPAALARGGPLVVTPWGSDLLKYPNEYRLITRLFLRLAMRRADLVLCNSSALAAAAAYFGAHPHRIRSVGQIVDLGCFRPGLDKARARAQLGVTGDPVLLSPRMLLPLYQIETVIDALAHVRRVFRGASLVLLGDPQLDPGYTAGLRAHIGRLGLQDAVQFAGKLPYAQMPEAFAAADVVLSLPSSDSRPSSVFEAMACGVPVVVSDLQAVREIVCNGETGLVAPVGDGRAAGEATLHLLQDAALRAQISVSALSYVRQAADYETQMQRVMRYYEELSAQ
jgi:glycosyltransferase involved in cell wall biosynthesis